MQYFLFDPLLVQNLIYRSIAANSAIENTNDKVLKPWQEIPGPSSLPLIGQLHHFLPGGKLKKKTFTNVS